jgi:hypothetical protein
MKIEDLKLLKASVVTGHTLVGVCSTDFPLSRGNCFSVMADDSHEYRIINFIVENWEEMIRRGIKPPIQIAVWAKNLAIVHDERIPDDWYREKFCGVCCPEELLPITQQLALDRDYRWGSREKTQGGIIIHLGSGPKL